MAIGAMGVMLYPIWREKMEMSFDDLDLDGLALDDLEVVSLKEAMALPETGASSGLSSTKSCSTCGSSSTCSSSQAARQ